MKFLLSCVFLLAVGSASFAADAPRKIDFTTILMDQDGAPFEECAEPNDRECRVKRPITLGAAAVRSLGIPEQNLDIVESQKRGQLAFGVYKATEAQLTAEEISLLKKQIAKTYNPLVAFKAFSVLDPGGIK